MEEAFEKTVLGIKFTNSLFGYNKMRVDKVIFDLCNEMSDLRQNHTFLLERIKRNEEMEKSISSAFLSAESSAKKIIESANESAKSIIEAAKAEAEAIKAQASENVRKVEDKARAIISEAEKLAVDLVSDADNQIIQIRDAAEQSIAFASAYQTALGQVDLTKLLNKHIIEFLNDLTSTIKGVV